MGPAAGRDGFAAATGTWLARLGLLRNVVRQEMVARQLAVHCPPPPADVLDVGCGQGTQALRLAAQGHRTTGVEPDPRLLAEFAASACGRGLADRVELLDGSLDGLADVIGDRRFDVVLCHGVLMYLADAQPALEALAARLRPGGLLSLLVRNADALALRPALRWDWAGAQAMFDAGDSDRGYVNEIGVRARADRVDELSSWLRRHRVRTEAWYGVRCFTDGVAVDIRTPDDPAELAALLDAEERAGRTDPYRRLGALTHLLGRARRRPDDEPGFTAVPYDSPVVATLTARVQGEYVVRYGGPDATPTEPREFSAPEGVFVVLDLDGEPVGCGGFRRHDERSAELKRMYVVPERRGQGLARALLGELERRARAAGYERLVLESGTAQPEALALYRSSGYAAIPGFGFYRDSPVNRCLGKAL